MAKNNNRRRGANPDPAETGRDNQQHQQKAKEGDYRNAETAVNNASYFDDDYEVKKEEEISHEEAKGENRKRTGKS